MTVKEFIDKVFIKSKEMNLEEFEIYYVSSETSSVKVFNKSLDSYSDSQNQGISFRAKIGDKMGYSYTESLEEKDILPLINEAIENGKIIENEDIIDIYGEKKEYVKLNTYSEELDKITTEEKIEFLLEAEKYALEYDKRVKSVNYCVFGSGKSERRIKNSKSLDLHDMENYGYTYLAVVVEENGVIKNDSDYIVSRDFKDFDSKKIGENAVKKALKKLGAVDGESGSKKIVIGNRALSDLLGAMGGIYSAENVQKGISKFKDKLGEKVASEKVSIIDNPHLEDGYGSSAFDAEGVPTENKKLIENGILKTYLYNLKTAKKDGVQTTGNGAKGGYKGTMGIAPFNLYMEKGDKSLEEILKIAENGIYVDSFAGLHSGLNGVSGDFSLACEGFLIENGKITKPLNQITLAGNFFDMLLDIEEVGNDLEFNLSAVGAPTILVGSLNVGS
ncbi:PmbA protein [Cetobacterium ceti]|uniref:PmbA protein n=1 Tax=Cetobacterium ceti TaxID=180163 RepID=A0A1T4MY58_9FUSO|nr:TldD/PmbA family protein [Cetobacterium ceti]SJZ72030.1 PmbA protein [Cetobacterium ceti]